MVQSSFDSTELPILAPRTHCVLIPRDPNYIYAYWDYTSEDINRLRNQIKPESASVQLILRVYDITNVKFNGSNANHTWDLEVGFSIKNWYINVWQDNADYFVQLGLSDGANGFIPLVRSNTVRTPPKTVSKRNDLIWQDIKGRYHVLKEKHLKKKTQAVKQPQSKRVYYLTAPDIRAYYMKFFSGVSKKARGKTPVLEDILKIKGAWAKVQPVGTSHDLIGRIHPGASEQGFIEKKGAGVSESLFGIQTGASENLLGIQTGASESLLGISPGASEGRLAARKFFFEVWTELIVHGRTEPDASVWLNNKDVKLNPDGTFTLRYALPDGEIPLKFIAQSSDGVEQRHINTRVEREKTIAFPKMLKEFHG